MAELNDAQLGGKSVTTELTQQRMVADAKTLDATKDPEKIKTFIYTCSEKGRFIPSDERNQPLPDDVMRQYKADPIHNSVITRVVYNKDINGNLVATNVVHYEILDEDPAIRRAQIQANMAAIISAPEKPILDLVKDGGITSKTGAIPDAKGQFAHAVDQPQKRDASIPPEPKNGDQRHSLPKRR
jgi:hypothetical protein